MQFERDQTRPLHTAQARSLRRRSTWTERYFWRELRKLDANFRRQGPIGPYFADFATRHPKLAIEIDGGVHERLADVAARDVERQKWLERDGYVVLRFTDRDVSGDVHGCIEKVRAFLPHGGGLGGGMATELAGKRGSAPTPKRAQTPHAADTPPSPTLPPSRRKGDAP